MDFQNFERLNSEDVAHPPESSENKTTFIRTCINGLNALSGVGILSIPFALSLGGWLSLVFLFVVAIVCYYTAILIQRSMSLDPRIRTYPDVGQLAFGTKGRLMISAFIYLELYLVLVEFVILEGDHLHKLFPNAHLHVGGLKLEGKQMFMIFSALIILPMTWLRSLGLLAYVSFSGILASLVLLVSVFWVGAFGGVGFHEEGSVWRWGGLPITISLYAFCYCGHAIFPTLYNSMEDKNQFPKVVLICFGLSTLSYGSMAVIGYLMFGNDLVSQVTLNLPIIKISSKIAIYTTLINPITKYAIYIAPIATAIEDTMPSQTNRSRIVSIFIRTTLVISTVVIALTIPFFGDVMNFIGAFLSISVSMLFPCVCYLKINKGYRRLSIELLLIIIIVTLGTLILVLGTYVSLMNIIQNVMLHHH